MKKLHLDALTIESFATSSAASGTGTVLGREGTPTCPAETVDCHVSWDGTCYFTCFETCAGCTGGPDCA